MADLTTIPDHSDPTEPPPARPDATPAASGRRRHWLVTVALLAAAVAGGLLAAQLAVQALRPHTWAGTAFGDPAPAAPLDSLTLASGEAVDLAAHRGDVVVLYFGYTFCPDVCPTTLADADQAIGGLGDRADDVHLYMISVDPARDPLDDLDRYMKHFNEDFAGIGGSPEAIAEAAALYGVFYELQTPDENGFYLVDHTATLMGIDPDGNLKVLWDPSVTPDQLRSDLEELLS